MQTKINPVEFKVSYMAAPSKALGVRRDKMVITMIEVKIMGRTVATKTSGYKFSTEQARCEWRTNPGSFQIVGLHPKGDEMADEIYEVIRAAETVILNDGFGDKTALKVAEWVVTRTDAALAVR